MKKAVFYLMLLISTLIYGRIAWSATMVRPTLHEYTLNGWGINWDHLAQEISNDWWWNLGAPYWNCDETENSFVKSWTLKEKNSADFRQSTVTCAELLLNGYPGDTYTRQHFSYTGTGRTGTTTVPDGYLPVGLVVHYKMGYSDVVELKLINVQLIYDRPLNIYEKRPESKEANAVFDDRFLFKKTLLCDEGHVMYGIEPGFYKDGPSDDERAEITGILIKCKTLHSRQKN
ncbi:MAG: hypothetical protein HQM16_06670 [Deltaproteobacteria bacterium]|nr:hypothetical protein [Deltaproteobacteria bacterium]